MSYFEKVIVEQKLISANIHRDLNYFKNEVFLFEKHKNAVNESIRWLDHELTDLRGWSSSTYSNWQNLSYYISNLDVFDRMLTNISIRFGLPRSTYLESYKILDRLCEELIIRTGFSSSPYSNIIVCGGGSYNSFTRMNLICCKSTDLYRFWNWGIVAHELAHDISLRIVPTSPPESSPRRVSRSRIITPQMLIYNWTKELLADIIGTLLIGPCLVLAHMYQPTFWTFYPSDESRILDFFSTHPPCEIRFLIHQRVLADIGILDSGLDRLTDIQTQVDMSNITEAERRVFTDRLEDIQRFTPLMIQWFEGIYPVIKSRINYFNSRDWELSKEFGKLILENKTNTVEGYSATHAINGLNYIRGTDLTLEREREIMDMILRYFIK